MEDFELDAAKTAANLLNNFGSDLLDNMSAKAAFHAMCAAAIAFGSRHFGLQAAAAWLRVLADELDQQVTKN